MGIIKSFIEQQKKRNEENNTLCNNNLASMKEKMDEIEQLFQSKKGFIEPMKVDRWQKDNAVLLDDLQKKSFRKLKKAKNYRSLVENQNQLVSRAKGLSKDMQKYNQTLATSKVPVAYSLIGDVEGRKLDEQQMACIVKDVHNHLVIAGAGTGKTTTIVGKIKYLLATKQCTPEEILVLSFTNASASEMRERIQKETKEEVAASTFHKLGLGILKKVDSVVPKISNLDKKTFIKEQVENNLKDKKYLEQLTAYLCMARVASKSEFDFENEASYHEYLEINPPVTLRHEKVKSYGEMVIANFLLQNGVNYVYEKEYEIDTRDNEYGQYRPDFYLSDHGIYIEYFGINRNGDVPAYFNGSHGMTAKEVYQEGMRWKREVHKQNNTVLVECYAYEKLEGILLETLETKLKSVGVQFHKKPVEDLWKELCQEGSPIDGVIQLFETVITLCKENNYSIEELKKIVLNHKNVSQNLLLVELVTPIFNAYNRYLSEHNEIDFSDMINKATRYIRDGKLQNTYKYVIVDEYQDISKARFELLKALRDSMFFDLFCVGDDWQSIYRFAGSDIGYILDFAKYWGASEISRIETTYRFGKQLIDVSGQFVMKNPKQIRKTMRGLSNVSATMIAEVSGYTEKNAIDFMVYKLADLPKNSTVFFVGRYAFDVDLLKNNLALNCKYNNVSGLTDVKYRQREDLRMSFVTAHKSKGLQAEYVFIINNKNSKMGFPSKIQDAPIIELLLENSDDYLYAEERRLFYVAMTRAKKKVFLVTVDKQNSSFVSEIKTRYADVLKAEKYECPQCGGKLVKKNGVNGTFLGCTNYLTNGCKYTRNIGKL